MRNVSYLGTFVNVNGKKKEKELSLDIEKLLVSQYKNIT